MAESPGSTLSSINSDDFAEEMRLKYSRELSIPSSLPGDESRSALPPSKRRRIGASTYDSARTPMSSALEDADPGSPATSISSDTSADVPNSPGAIALLGGAGGSGDTNDDDKHHDQISACRWEGCDAGDLGNMDNLVQHIHDQHIGTKANKYACEWDDCARKGHGHASGYALRAHMRSHTREKPFYCQLPGMLCFELIMKWHQFRSVFTLL